MNRQQVVISHTEPPKRYSVWAKPSRTGADLYILDGGKWKSVMSEEILKKILDDNIDQYIDIEELTKKTVKIPNEYLKDVGSGNKSNVVTITGFDIPVPDLTPIVGGAGPGQMSAYFIDKYLKDEWDEVLNTIYKFAYGSKDKTYDFYFDGVPTVTEGSDGSLSIIARIAVLSSNGKVTDYRYLGFQVDDTTDFDVNTTETSILNSPAENYKKQILIISHPSSDTIIAIAPDQYHRWGEMTSLTISLETSIYTDILHEYMFEFTSGATPTTLSLPANLLYGMKGAPTIKANTTYEFHIQQDKVAWEAYLLT